MDHEIYLLFHNDFIAVRGRCNNDSLRNLFKVS